LYGKGNKYDSFEKNGEMSLFHNKREANSAFHQLFYSVKFLKPDFQSEKCKKPRVKALQSRNKMRIRMME